ncbi:RNA polymerase sigma factor [Nonomuraea sp. NPDC049400]|uniref:RNA polymerase sigma factor n=1 Tax=Nonomuraea sp. NPDC049400 TaxID=3364352 RepID=UPI0037973E35
MWRTLSDDARQAIRELCDKHGARLYDYCRTELAAGDAEQAVAGAALTAHLYADRVVDPALRRPWLYAVARAHRAVVAKPASIGSWSRPGRMSELLPEALLSLDRPQRELLDLSLRHGLADTELAVIFELRQDEVRAIVTRAAASLEEWFAAIIAARGHDGCPDLTARVSDWVAAPGRRARARIGRHIQSCATCRAAPRTVSAAALLRRLPITTLPGTLPNRLALAQPLPGEGPLWRADGFPVQARTLVETGPSPAPPVADAMPQVPVAGPTTATSGKPWSAAGAAAADQEPPAAPAVRGRHPFTPPSRTRAFRGGAYGDKLVYSAAVKGSSNGVHSQGAIIRYGGITMTGDLVELRDGQVQEFWRERPDDDDPEAGPPIRAVARLGLVVGVGLLVAGLVWAVVNAQRHPATLTKAAAQTGVLQEPPSGYVAEVAPVAGSGLTSMARKATLPRPAPPVARLTPSSVSLGSGRTGTFALSCTGSCEITSATGTDGITVSGTTFKVRAPLSRHGCSPSVERGKITVRWAGRTTGDGKDTGGTTAGRGALTMSVTWTVAGKGGVRMLDRERGVVYCR